MIRLMMNKYLPKFKAMVVTNDPMTNPADGWVTGFFYEDLCLNEKQEPIMKSFIRSGEMIWEVIPESVHASTPLKDSDEKIIYDGDIVSVMFSDGSNAACLVGYDNSRMGFGLMDDRYFSLMKQGYFKEESYSNILLVDVIEREASIRIIGNIFENEKLLILEI